MQEITFYATANETLGTVRDYANAKTVAAPTLTKSVSVRLLLRLFADANDLDPVPLDTFANIRAWAFVMDDDFNDETTLKIVADNDGITVTSETETTTDPDTGATITRTYTQFSIPISEMNSAALAAWLGTSESKGSLIGELTGYDGNGDSVFVLQIKGFTVRNRLYGSGEPSENVNEYLTIDEARAMFADAATSEENAFQPSMIVSGADDDDLNGTYRFYAKTPLPWLTNQSIYSDVFINENKKTYIRFTNGYWMLGKAFQMGANWNTEIIYKYPWTPVNSNVNMPPTDYWYKIKNQSNTPTKTTAFFRFLPRLNVLKKSY